MKDLKNNSLEMKSKTAIISPSGNFYGSEQVLFDFLNYSKFSYDVFVPANSTLERKVGENNRHQVKTFPSVKRLYIKLFFQLFTKYSSIYINEGGHIKYIKVIANIFHKRRFYVQIRLLDDTARDRIQNLPKNIEIICVSNFIAKNLDSSMEPKVINDPFELPELKETKEIDKKKPFRIGFIGRVTPTKGLGAISELLEALEKNKMKNQISFFGHVEREKLEVQSFLRRCEGFKFNEVIFRGFVDNKFEMYSNLDLLMHLNKHEAFPRVVLEGWSHNVPVVGFDAGGVGEINRQLEVRSFLLTVNQDWSREAIDKIEGLKKEFPIQDIERAKGNIQRKLGISDFVKELESCIN